MVKVLIQILNYRCCGGKITCQCNIRACKCTCDGCFCGD